MATINNFITELDTCPPGSPGWRKFEDICLEILTYLFVPPLSKPKVQLRTFSGLDQRDAVFPNRNTDTSNVWGFLLHELNARLILFEFKNYDSTEIGKDEVNQTLNYLTKPMGNLAILLCNKEPHKSAYKRRNVIYSEYGKVILLVTKEHLKEMLSIKERGDDPADLIIDMIETFYLDRN
ncbi:hypothetical protein [Bacillus cereus]|uniref:hypothetical protein n=1 Tax=Bacillus cereus TaxID=1396 RepID=UPI002ABEA662|nr:hypothetical protein [Bacillus cereus]MDZ4496906.1 hypothetical protein [Bacillus cereus]MDZ4519226.1 hypothetical protein [Bacillus cereus]